MQPFGEKNDDLPTGDAFFFAPNKTFDVKVWKDLRAPGESALGLVAEVYATEPVATGTLTLREEVVVDVEKLNRDLWREDQESKVGKWIERFGRIGKEVDRV